MKDEHDKSTIDLEQVVPGEFKNVHSLVLNPARVRELRRMQGLPTFVSALQAAAELRVSARRVRALLGSGRLQGRQHENGYWEVSWPFTITDGRRGPKMRRNGIKNPEGKTECNRKTF